MSLNISSSAYSTTASTSGRYINLGLLVAGTISVVGAAVNSDVSVPSADNRYFLYGRGLDIGASPRGVWRQHKPSIERSIESLALDLVSRQRFLEPEIEKILSKNMHLLYE